MVVRKMEKRIPAIAAARGVFNRARIGGESCAISCIIRNTSRPNALLLVLHRRSLLLDTGVRLPRRRVIRFQCLKCSCVSLKFCLAEVDAVYRTLV